MLGTLMFVSKVIMDVLPNIHLIGVLTMIYTVAFRVKAMIPLYVFIFLNALYALLFSGPFGWMWCLPYLYIWTILWGVTMLLPKRMPKKLKYVLYPLVCCLHGLAFGTLYAPAQALMFGFTKEQTIAWIISGLPWDLLHGVSNFCVGFLILPLSELLQKLMRKAGLAERQKIE